jgi:microcystin-dependent protein
VRRIFGVVLIALAVAAPARAGGPSLLVGAAEDNVRQPTLTEAKAKLDLLKLVGMNAVRVTSIWDPANPVPDAGEVTALSNVSAAAKLDGMQMFTSVYNFGSKTTPLTDDAQVSFANYAATLARQIPDLTNFIIGNEPNINRFWLPQFNADGSDAAAPAYLSLLSRTYAALKSVNPAIKVFGGAVSPRGIDRPGTGRDTHSPTVFIQDLGKAYRASGLTGPVMDAFVFHPYPENSSVPPTFAHPNTPQALGIADYQKLVALLGAAFDGTGQPGSTLPILYGEYGIETQIPATKAGLYTGAEPTTIKPVPEATQAAYYKQAIAITFCQPNVMGILMFHAFDESALDRFQSGLYYADGTPKSSLATVRDAVRQAHGGVIAKCPDMELTPQVKVTYPRIRSIAAGTAAVAVTCDIDCNVYARLERLPRHSTTLATRAVVLAGERTLVRFRQLQLAPGQFRFTVRATAPVNVGPPTVVTSPTLIVR